MRFLSHGPAATLLMLVPVVIVPLLAVFGIPEFAPVSASPQQEGSDAADDFGFAGPVRRSSGEGFAPVREGDRREERLPAERTAPGDSGPMWTDPFRSVTPASGADGGESRAAEPEAAGVTGSADGGRGTAPSQESPAFDWDPPPEAVRGWAWEESPSKGVVPAGFDELPADSFPDVSVGDEGNRPAGGSGASPAAEGGGDPSSGPLDRLRAAAESDAHSEPWASPSVADRPLTWRSAVDRLNELGIRHFQLQPGVRENEFHFSCLYTPEDNPRITHRFEAEANAPLRAVAKVLAQIDSWKKPR